MQNKTHVGGEVLIDQPAERLLSVDLQNQNVFLIVMLRKICFK